MNSEFRTPHPAQFICPGGIKDDEKMSLSSDALHGAADQVSQTSLLLRSMTENLEKQIQKQDTFRAQCGVTRREELIHTLMYTESDRSDRRLVLREELSHARASG